MTRKKDLGPASAYAYAKIGGYKGTEQEFAEWLARCAQSDSSTVTAESIGVATSAGGRQNLEKLNEYLAEHSNVEIVFSRGDYYFSGTINLANRNKLTGKNGSALVKAGDDPLLLITGMATEIADITLRGNNTGVCAVLGTETESCRNMAWRNVKINRFDVGIQAVRAWIDDFYDLECSFTGTVIDVPGYFSSINLWGGNAENNVETFMKLRNLDYNAETVSLYGMCIEALTGDVIVCEEGSRGRINIVGCNFENSEAGVYFVRNNSKDVLITFAGDTSVVYGKPILSKTRVVNPPAECFSVIDTPMQFNPVIPYLQNYLRAYAYKYPDFSSIKNYIDVTKGVEVAGVRKAFIGTDVQFDVYDIDGKIVTADYTPEMTINQIRFYLPEDFIRDEFTTFGLYLDIELDEAAHWQNYSWSLFGATKEMGNNTASLTTAYRIYQGMYEDVRRMQVYNWWTEAHDIAYALPGAKMYAVTFQTGWEGKSPQLFRLKGVAFVGNVGGVWNGQN